MDLLNQRPAGKERSRYDEQHPCPCQRRKPRRPARQCGDNTRWDYAVSWQPQRRSAPWLVLSARVDRRIGVKTVWRCSRVEGFRTTAERRTGAGRMNIVQKPAMIR